MAVETAPVSRPAIVGATLLAALPAFLLSNPGFRPFEARLEGSGPTVTRTFRLDGPEALYLDYELVEEASGVERPPVIVSLNGTPVARLAVEALSRQQSGRAPLPVAATQAGDNRLELAPASPGATIDVRARVHNYYGIAPDVPRAAIVSDEAVGAWWSGASGLAHAGWFAALFAIACALVSVLAWRAGPAGGRAVLFAPAALLLPIAVWSAVSELHVWLFPETLALAALVPLGLVAAGRAIGRHRTLLLKLAAATMATLLMLEGALRLTNAIRPSFIFYADSYGRYRGQPGAPHHGTVLNSRGFNDVERAVSRPPDVAARVVALGDSFAFGVVPYADNYLTLTERALSTDGKVEVINMGVSATGPDDYRAILVDEGLSYGPDVVLVSVYLGNDLESRRRRWFERSYVTTLGNFVWHLARARQTVVLDRGADAPYDDDAPSLDEGSFRRIQMERATLYTSSDEALAAAVDSAVRALVDIRDLARARGAGCLVVLIPDETQVDAGLQAEVARAWGLARDAIDVTRPSRLMGAALARANVETLDLLPAFARVGREARLYKPRDTHWNIAGNRLAAEEMAPVVRAMLARRASGERSH